MKLLKEDLKNIIREELRKLLDEISRRGFLRGAAAMCAAGISSACETENQLGNIIKKNKKGLDFPKCVYYPKIEPDLNDQKWQEQVINFQSGEYVGVVELIDFMSQPAFDNEYTYIEEDGEFLVVTFTNVPKDADIFNFNGITGTGYISDSEIESFFDPPQGEVVLIVLKIKFKIFEYEGELYIHHPSYERGGFSTIPLRNSLECSKSLIKWMEN